MNDYLQNATLRNVLKTLNIPVPVPPILKRNLNAFSDDELSNKEIVITGKENELRPCPHRISRIFTLMCLCNNC